MKGFPPEIEIGSSVSFGRAIRSAQIGNFSKPHQTRTELLKVTRRFCSGRKEKEFFLATTVRGFKDMPRGIVLVFLSDA